MELNAAPAAELEPAAGNAVESAPPRRGPAFHPVLIEVAGCMEDAAVHDITQRLRRYRNRYSPLLRCMFTLVAATVPEADLFGDDASNDTAAAAVPHSHPLFRSPTWAVSVNKTYPLVRRLHASGAASARVVSPLPEGRCASSELADTKSMAPAKEGGAAAPMPWTDCEASGSCHSFCFSRSSNSCKSNSSGPDATDTTASSTSFPERAAAQLEHFMAYHFLPFAMTHDTQPSPASAAAAAVAVAEQSAEAPSLHGEATSSTECFVMRHYVNEASRTSSFLIADPYHPPHGATSLPDPAQGHGAEAVLIDPREEQLEAYVADVASLGATLAAVIFTHCYVDGSSGLAELTARFPKVRVLSGLPLSPAGTARTLPLSSHVSLRTVAVPAFSPECLLVEVHAGGRLVGLCTGVLWSTDAAPRWDLLQWAPFPRSSPKLPSEKGVGVRGAADAAAEPMPYGGGDREAALRHTYSVLRAFFFEPYLAPLCPSGAQTQAEVRKTARADDAAEALDTAEAAPSSIDATTRTSTPPPPAPSATHVDSLQRVVLMPTHGGYSNVTNQLDLYWGAYLGDLARMKHSRAVIDTLAGTADGFVKYNTRLPRLPHPPLFDASRLVHLRQLLAHLSGEERAACVAQLSHDMRGALAASVFSVQPGSVETLALAFDAAPSPRAYTGYVNLVDVRDAKEYHALHLSGSVNVPMSFPGVAYGARRAELWLQCLLVPHQPILVLCASPAQRVEVRRRFAALSPGCAVCVFTLEDVPEVVSRAAEAFEGSAEVPWREFHAARPRDLPAACPVPQDLVWVQHAGALPRLTAYEHLVAIEPTETRVVLDVRTPYEFKNGSHQHSVHVELAELCTLAAEDAMRSSLSTAPPCWHVGSSAQLADVYMEKIHTTALLAGLPVVRQESQLSDVVIYCAGGYRSLIAASLLQRAMETSANAAWRRLRIADVSGGAFQIMTQRPDLWRVKDRSIICIS